MGQGEQSVQFAFMKIWFCKRQKRELEAKSSKFQSKAHVMQRLDETFEYATTLSLLLRNDSNTRDVDGTAFPHGHGETLVEALRHNTVVEQLDLALYRFLVDKCESRAKREMKGLLEFLASSRSLVHFDVEGPTWEAQNAIEHRAICFSKEFSNANSFND